MSENPEDYELFRWLGENRPILPRITTTELSMLRMLWSRCLRFMTKVVKFFEDSMYCASLVDWLWIVFKAEEENIPLAERNSPGLRLLARLAEEENRRMERMFGDEFHRDGYPAD